MSIPSACHAANASWSAILYDPPDVDPLPPLDWVGVVAGAWMVPELLELLGVLEGVPEAELEGVADAEAPELAELPDDVLLPEDV
jgi:hypothetical protein